MPAGWSRCLQPQLGHLFQLVAPALRQCRSQEDLRGDPPEQDRDIWKQGWKEEAIGEVDPERLNPTGSSIALGHPFAATGARIVTRLAYEMHLRGARYGLISICAAGGMGAGMILQRD